MTNAQSDLFHRVKACHRQKGYLYGVDIVFSSIAHGMLLLYANGHSYCLFFQL